MLKNKKMFVMFLLLCVLLFFVSVSSFANEDGYLPFSIGYSITNYNTSFGLNLNFSSPTFFANAVRVRANVNINWLNALTNTGGTIHYNWFPYFSANFVLTGGAFVNPFIRLYGYGGLYVLAGNKDIMSYDYKFGAVGGFGFEFYFNRKHFSISYFIELGSCGIDAKADKLLYYPIISNGYVISTGFRFYL